jgi:hypothetical protein
MSLENKLKTDLEQRKLVQAEKEKAVELEKNNELHAQIGSLTQEKNDWEQNLGNLESGYKTAGGSLQELQKYRKKINNIYTNPEFTEVMGDKSKAEFIQENENEEEIKAYRGQENVMRNEVGALSGLKSFFKEKLLGLDFRGGNKGGKTPRQESIKKIKEEISEKNKNISALYEQTTEGKQELEQKNKEKIINYHLEKEKRSHQPNYTEITTFDIEQANTLGEQFVKDSLIELNQNKINEYIEQEIKKNGLDKKIVFIEFVDQYPKDMQKVERELNTLSTEVRLVGEKLTQIFEKNKNVLVRFREYYRGTGFKDLGVQIVNGALGYLIGDYFSHSESPDYFKNKVKEVIDYKNKDFDTILKKDHLDKYQDFSDPNIVNPNHVMQQVAEAKLVLQELEKFVDADPLQLLDQKNADIKKLIQSENLPKNVDETFYIDRKIIDFFNKEGNLSLLKKQTKAEQQLMENKKHDMLVNSAFEIENNWSEQKLLDFTQKNPGFIDRLKNMKNNKQVAAELVSDLSVLNPNMYKDRQVQVTSKVSKGGYGGFRTENYTSIYPQVRDKYSDIRTEINNLENKKQLLTQEISENENTKRGLLNKKKLEADLIEKKNSYKDIVSELNTKNAMAENMRSEMEYIQKIQSMVNKHLEYTIINVPNGTMTVTEFIDKAKEVLQQIQQEQLPPVDEEKNKEYKNLQARLTELKNQWNGKKVWQNINK